MSLLIPLIGFAQGPVFTNPSLTPPYDLSQFEFAKRFNHDLSIGTGLSFNDDGSKMYVLHRLRDAIAEFELASPYDISTAVYLGDAEGFSIGNDDSSPLVFNNNGTRMFNKFSNNTIRQYRLQTAFDVSTASYLGQPKDFTLGPESAFGRYDYFELNSDGSKLFVGDFSTIFEYDLATKFDLSTASFLRKIESLPSNDRMIFSNDGSQAFLLIRFKRAVNAYDLATPYDLTHSCLPGRRKRSYSNRS